MTSLTNAWMRALVGGGGVQAVEERAAAPSGQRRCDGALGASDALGHMGGNWASRRRLRRWLALRDRAQAGPPIAIGWSQLTAASFLNRASTFR